jgi:2-polyprenyl-3-methyl-5-hydroxy-6-metoxy-1,4-benzoquinol methylase
MMPASNLDLSRYEYAMSVIERLSAAPASQEVFDVGCGDGRLKEAVEGAGFCWKGFDLKPASAEIAQWNLQEPCPAEIRAAVVLLLDVIEHTVNPGMALASLFGVMEPGGILILTAPNPRWSRSRIHALLYGTPACFTQSDLDLNGHVFTSWPHVLERMLCDAGFEIVEFVTLDGRTSWPRGPVT